MKNTMNWMNLKYNQMMNNYHIFVLLYDVLMIFSFDFFSFFLFFLYNMFVDDAYCMNMIAVIDVDANDMNDHEAMKEMVVDSIRN